MIRIITTRKLRFYSPDRTENFVTSGNNIIEDCPDWAEKDGMFQAAKAHGVLQVITAAPAQKVLENNLVLPQNAHEADAMLNDQNPKNESEVDTSVKTKKKRKSKAPKE